MTSVRVRLREQTDVQQYASNAAVSWVPTLSVPVTAGLLLPAPKAIGFSGTEVVFAGLEPCDGMQGWVWQVTITSDGIVRDRRNVIVPDTADTIDLEDLAALRLDQVASLSTDQVWIGLEGDPPPAWFRGWWLVSAPGNPALGDNTGSGDLRIVT